MNRNSLASLDPSRSSSGFTLVELLVGMTLSLIVMSAVLTT
ncbi:MAG: prepilin-type N-terminal cleavage/methylation domain-containing protein [bacterium]|nr:prepilin-type N-terminal cleavage/methylation domain-containing protein [bacterium]